MFSILLKLKCKETAKKHFFTEWVLIISNKYQENAAGFWKTREQTMMFANSLIQNW